MSYEQYTKAEEDFAEYCVLLDDELISFKIKYKLNEEQIIALLEAEIKQFNLYDRAKKQLEENKVKVKGKD